MSLKIYYSEHQVRISSENLGGPQVEPFYLNYDKKRKINFLRILCGSIGLTIKKNYIESQTCDSPCPRSIDTISGTLFCNIVFKLLDEHDNVIEQSHRPFQFTMPNKKYVFDVPNIPPIAEDEFYNPIIFTLSMDVSKKYPKGLGELRLWVAVEDMTDQYNNPVASESGIYAIFMKTYSFLLNPNDSTTIIPHDPFPPIKPSKHKPIKCYEISQQYLSKELFMKELQLLKKNVNNSYPYTFTLYDILSFENLERPFLSYEIKLLDYVPQFVEMASGYFFFYVNIDPSWGKIECKYDNVLSFFNTVQTLIRYQVLKDGVIVRQAVFERNQVLSTCFEGSNNVPTFIPIYHILDIKDVVFPGDTINVRVFLEDVVDACGNSVMNNELKIKGHVDLGIAYNIFESIPL